MDCVQSVVVSSIRAHAEAGIRSWQQLKERLASRWSLFEDSPTWVSIAFSAELGDRRILQKVQVHLVADAGDLWVVVLTPVCGEGQLSAPAALARNARLAVGTLAFQQELYVLRACLWLSVLGWSQLERTIEALAADAVQLRADCTPNVSDPGVFTAYAG